MAAGVAAAFITIHIDVLVLPLIDVPVVVGVLFGSYESTLPGEIVAYLQMLIRYTFCDFYTLCSVCTVYLRA